MLKSAVNDLRLNSRIELRDHLPHLIHKARIHVKSWQGVLELRGRIARDQLPRTPHTEAHRLSERGSVQRHRPMIAHHQITCNEHTTPPAGRGCKHQTPINCVPEPCPHLPDAMTKPHIRVKDRRDTELIDRKFSDQPRQQRGLLCDQRVLTPRGAHRHQTHAVADTDHFLVPVRGREAHPQTVKDRIARRKRPCPLVIQNIVRCLRRM